MINYHCHSDEIKVCQQFLIVQLAFLKQKKFLIDQEIFKLKPQVTCIPYMKNRSSSALKRKVVLHLNKLTMPSLNNSVEQLTCRKKLQCSSGKL